MDAARIAELLAPFLRGPSEHSTNVCHPGLPQAPGASLERSRKPALSLSRQDAAALPPVQLRHISTYIDILLRWNARINLTAVRDPEEIVTRHFGESLFAARHLFPDGKASGRASLNRAVDPSGRAALQGRVGSEEEKRALAPEAIRVADVGSGAGFPGLPLKIWAPNISLTLIESNHKKVAFLREVCRALTLTNVNIQNARAETLAGSAFDVVTLRAVERFESILPTAASLLAPAACLALLVGSTQQDQAGTTLPQFVWSTPIPIPNSRSRILLLGHNKD